MVMRTVTLSIKNEKLEIIFVSKASQGIKDYFKIAQKIKEAEIKKKKFIYSI